MIDTHTFGSIDWMMPPKMTMASATTISTVRLFFQIDVIKAP
jgi:hypothetical protein